MHVLLISSNDLNEKNIFPSIFELAQAKALKARGIKVGILSVGYYTTSNVSKALWKKIFRGSYNYYRFKGLNYAGLTGEFFRTFFNAAVSHTDVRKFNVQGVTVYEALFNDFYFTLNKRGHKKWVGHGFKAYKEYIRDHGLPDIIHAHSRFLMGGLLAKKIKGKTAMPYVLTTHSSFYKRNLIKDFRKPLIKEVIEASDKALAVSATLAKDVSERLGTDFDMEVMPNIIDDTFEEAVLSSKANDVFSFVSIGRLDENKNQQLLIRAFAAAVKKGMPAVLHLGGAGPELENLKKLAVKEGVEKKVMF